MSAGAVRGGQVFVEIKAEDGKLLAKLRGINERIGQVGETLKSAGLGMAAFGAAISGPILGLGMAFVEQTAEMQAMNRALKDVGQAVAEAVAPAFVGFANIIAGAAKAVSKFIRANQGLIRAAVVVGGYFTAWGLATYGVGLAMSTLSRAVAASIGPITAFAAIAVKAVAAVGAFAVSGPVLAVVAVLGGIAAGAAVAGVDLLGLAKTIGGAFGSPIAGLMSLFGDLLGTVNLTIEGIYRAISAGDLAGAVDVLWAGWQAAWARGEQAVMGTLDPFIEAVQNSMSDLGVGLAAAWDQMWTDIATSEWGGYLLGAMDNVLNGVMAYWDNLIGYIEKGWTEMWRRLGRITDEAAKVEFARIDAANAGNAAQRGRDRPGFAGRTGLTDEQKAAMQQESKDRQAAMLAEGDKMRKDRGDRTRQNVVDRAAAVAAANKNLQAQVDRFPVPNAVAMRGNLKTETAGTFSAFGLGQLGTGSVEKQQLDELRRIREELQRQARVGGIGP
jgi:hypothetical protein